MAERYHFISYVNSNMESLGMVIMAPTLITTINRGTEMYILCCWIDDGTAGWPNERINTFDVGLVHTMIAVNASLAPLIPFLLSATYNPGKAQRFFTPPTSIHARFQILPPCSLTNDTFPLSPRLISLDPSYKCMVSPSFYHSSPCLWDISIKKKSVLPSTRRHWL